MFNIRNVTQFVGEKIKNLREKSNITQQELAEAIGTTQQSIARYESGERKANQNVLFSLSEYFKIPIDDFFPERTISNNYFDEVKIKSIMNETIKNYEERKNNNND